MTYETPAPAGSHPSLNRVLNVQRRLREGDRRHPWLLDAAVPLLVAMQELPRLLGRTEAGDLAARTTQLPAAVVALMSFGVVVPLFWRRRAPLAAFSVVAAVVLVQWMLGAWQPVDVALLIALFDVALHGPLNRLPWATLVAAGGVTLAAFRFPSDHSSWLDLFFLLGTVTAAVALGLAIRSRRTQLAALQAGAAATERTRVAREMHDIIGHNLAVIVGLADGAAALAAANPARSEEALRMIAGTGRQALGELRRALGVLRDEPEGTALSPQPGIADLEPLLERVRAAGRHVTYRTAGDLPALAPGLQLTVYRIVQEALTNTLKHGGASGDTRVALRYDGRLVRITVEDGGPGNGPAARSPGARDTGQGLIGMRERAAMYGGTVSAGPRPGGGWTVEAVLDAASAPASVLQPGERA